MMLYPRTKLNKLKILSRLRWFKSESDMECFRSDKPPQGGIVLGTFWLFQNLEQNLK
jgi:hypothetical protein